MQLSNKQQFVIKEKNYNTRRCLRTKTDVDLVLLNSFSANSKISIKSHFEN